jgi:small subunit ribosomal protein S19e
LIKELPTIGVQKLRIKYGGNKNRGHKPSRFYKSSGKIIRLILQQLEKAEFIKKTDAGVHKGRVIAPKGKSFLARVLMMR